QAQVMTGHNTSSRVNANKKKSILRLTCLLKNLRVEIPCQLSLLGYHLGWLLRYRLGSKPIPISLVQSSRWDHPGRVAFLAFTVQNWIFVYSFLSSWLKKIFPVLSSWSFMVQLWSSWYGHLGTLRSAPSARLQTKLADMGPPLSTIKVQSKMSNTSTPNPSIYTISTDYPPTSSFNEDGNPISSFGSIHTPPFLREMVEDVFGGSLNGSNYCILISGEQLAPRVLCKSHRMDHYQFSMLINWTTVNTPPANPGPLFIPNTPPPPYTTGYNLAANLTGFAQSSNDDNALVPQIRYPIQFIRQIPARWITSPLPKSIDHVQKKASYENLPPHLAQVWDLSHLITCLSSTKHQPGFKHSNGQDTLPGWCFVDDKQLLVILVNLHRLSCLVASTLILARSTLTTLAISPTRHLKLLRRNLSDTFVRPVIARLKPLLSIINQGQPRDSRCRFKSASSTKRAPKVSVVLLRGSATLPPDISPVMSESEASRCVVMETAMNTLQNTVGTSVSGACPFVFDHPNPFDPSLTPAPVGALALSPTTLPPGLIDLPSDDPRVRSRTSFKHLYGVLGPFLAEPSYPWEDLPRVLEISQTLHKAQEWYLESVHFYPDVTGSVF
ncbi:hypothetical protein MJO28_015898, partial [Puccinia striiformis f. sp. tritici]